MPLQLLEVAGAVESGSCCRLRFCFCGFASVCDCGDVLLPVAGLLTFFAELLLLLVLELLLVAFVAEGEGFELENDVCEAIECVWVWL